MLLFEAFERYKTRKLLGAAANTEGKFRRAIVALGLVVGRLPTVDDLTDDNVSDVVASVIRKGRTAYTANGYRSKLVALWTFAAKRGWVKTFPDIDAAPVEHANPVAWTRAELARVIAATAHARQPICGVPGAVWFRALLLVLWDTGERIGAVLKTEAAQLAGNSLTVIAAHRKGKTRDMVYTLHPDTVAALAAIRAIYTGPMLFPRDCSAETVANRWRSCLKREGLPSDRKHLFHCMRRSVASHAAAAGGNATSLLDHSSAATTRESYIDRRIAPQPRAIDVLFRPDAA